MPSLNLGMWIWLLPLIGVALAVIIVLQSPKASVLRKEKTEEVVIEPLKLLDSFPKDNEVIKTEDVKQIYLKFNKPIDKATVPYIVNYLFRENTEIQWTVGGWIEYAEDDTKLIWHVNEDTLQKKYATTEGNYHSLEIHVGSTENFRLKATDGSVLPITKLRVKIK